jgi:hypothetical protein
MQRQAGDLSPRPATANDRPTVEEGHSRERCPGSLGEGRFRWLRTTGCVRLSGLLVDRKEEMQMLVILNRRVRS